MLNDNIRLLRKQKGYSQEALAEKLHVVRQTVSKWEKGLSVPDADMLARLAEVFEVSAATLLGGPIAPENGDKDDAIAEQLAQINEQLVIRNRRSRRVFRTVLGVVLGLIALYVLLVVLGMVSFSAVRMEGRVVETQYEEFQEETTEPKARE